MTSRQNAREAWEQRAAIWGENPRGVLLRNLPEELNAAVASWHEWIVQTIMAPMIRGAGRVVDVGAGYGRVSSALQATRPDLLIFGCDLSLTYCRLYRRPNRAVICADLTQCPWGSEIWDGLVAVTALMYVEGSEMVRTSESLLRSLKPGGVMLIIDPGKEVLDFLAFCGGTRSPTGGEGFCKAEYRGLLQKRGFSVVAAGSNVFFTLLAPLMLTLKRIPMAVRFLSGVSGYLDRRFGRYARFALHRWIVVRRDP